MATPAAVLSIMVKAQGAQAAIGQLNGVDAAARKASGGVDALGKSNAKGRAAMDRVGRGAGIVALGVGAIGVAAVKAASNYQTSMNTLQAVSGSTGAEMNKLSKLAIKLGADVKLPGTSAQDAAEAMTEMIKAGVSLKDTMAGVRSTLVLSAAAGISNKDAAEIASNALNAFKLKGKEVAMVADQLANTANASSVEIRDVADSFKMAAAVFSGFQAKAVDSKKGILTAKGAVTELNVAIGLLGNAGIKGSDAGTSLKQMLLQLTGPSNRAKDAMQALYYAAKGNAGAEGELTGALRGTGKERAAALESLAKLNPALKGGGDIAYTSAGKMRSLKDIIALVTAGTKNMTDEQKAAYVTQIFGADATRSVIALMNAGPAAFDKMTASVTRQGAAQALADAKMKGFKGSLQALQSTLETLAINVGTKLLPALTSLVRMFSSVAGALSPTVWLVLIGVIGSLSLAVFGINAAMKVYTAATTAATAAQWLFNAALTANPIGVTIVAIAALGAAVVIAYQKSKTFRDIVNSVGEALRNMLINRISMVLGAFSSFLGGIAKVAHALGADGLARKAAEGQHAIDDLRDSLRNVPAHKDVDVSVKIKLDGQSIDVTNAKPLSPTPPGGDGPGVIGSRINDLVRSDGRVHAGIKKLVADGLGSMIPGIGATAGKVGSLMGANSSLRPFAAVGAQFGLHVSSGKRAAGARTSSGGISYHGSGQAIDLANGKGPDAAKMGAFKALKSRYGPMLAELIYTPGGAGIKNGQPFTYTGQVARDHFDHVHVAFTGASGGGGRAQAVTGDGPGRLSGVNLAIDAARKAGFKGTDLVNMIAIAGRESSYSPSAHNYDPPRDDSWGLWQINVLPNANPKYKSWNLSDPYVNAKAAHQLFAGAGLRPWNHAGGPLGGTNVGAARAAVQAFKGGGAASSSAGSNAASGAAATAAKVNPLDQKLAGADLAIEEAKRFAGMKVAGHRIGLGKGAAQAQAMLGKRKLIGARIRSIRKALKGHLSGAKRLALTNELTQRLGEHAQLGTDIAALRTPAAAVSAGGDGGGGGGGDFGTGDDPNQALIDSNAALQAAIDTQVQAEKEHTDAVNAAREELKRQTDFAASATASSNYQAWKALADILSGQIGGRGVVGRSYTPGSGVEHSY